MPDFSLAGFQFLSYPSPSNFLSLSLSPTSDTDRSVALSLPFSCPLHSHSDLTKLDDIFRVFSPSPFSFHLVPQTNTPLLEEQSSIRALIMASFGMHSSSPRPSTAVCFVFFVNRRQDEGQSWVVCVFKENLPRFGLNLHLSLGMAPPESDLQSSSFNPQGNEECKGQPEMARCVIFPTFVGPYRRY